MCLTQNDVLDIIENLAGNLTPTRPYYCSEGDFQAQMIKEIETRYPDLIAISEYPYQVNQSTNYIDIAVINRLTNEKCFIELKYKTRFYQATNPNRLCNLNAQGGQDRTRVSFLRDIARLEDINIAHKYAILLTNDHLYWMPTPYDTHDLNYRLHGEINLPGQIFGQLAWGHNPQQQWVTDMGVPITLNGNYQLTWSDFTQHPVFRYLLVEVQ